MDRPVGCSCDDMSDHPCSVCASLYSGTMDVGWVVAYWLDGFCMLEIREDSGHLPELLNDIKAKGGYNPLISRVRFGVPSKERLPMEVEP